MANERFRADFAKILKKAGDNAALVARKTMLSMQASLIEKSPVDTGRFKGNWQAGIGTPNEDVSAPENSDALGRAGLVLRDWRPGQTLYLTNSLPYSKRLENGWSQQAPSGMVRLTVQQFGDAFAKAASEVEK